MKFFRELESDKIQAFILTTGILLLVFSFLLPLPLLLFLQDLLFFSYDHLLFIRPRAGFTGLTLGMILIAVSMLSFLFTKILAEKAGRPYRWTLPHLLGLATGLLLIFLSINHYYFLEEERVGENSFFRLSERDLAFDQVDQVSRKVVRSNYEVLSYSFSSGDLLITIPYNSQDPEASRVLYYLIDKYGWEVRDDFVQGK